MDRLVKEVPHCEVQAYESVQGTALEGLFATYFGHESKGVLYSVTLHDMTAGMARPCVMDIKMGKRTFLESEVKAGKLRPDLAAKMVKLDPTALTEAEVAEGVTKLRYMQFREVRALLTSLHSSHCNFTCRDIRYIRYIRYTRYIRYIRYIRFNRYIALQLHLSWDLSCALSPEARPTAPPPLLASAYRPAARADCRA